MTTHTGQAVNAIQKKSTGIDGLDDITGGGLPELGLTAVSGGPGAGKTVLALQTIFHRLTRHGEPAIFVTFEEPEAQIWRHAASFAWGAGALDLNKIQVLDARLPIDVVGSGDFDLSALLTGLSAIVEETGARNVVFDGIDVLLSGLATHTLERRELSRLADWLYETDLFGILTVKSEGLADRDRQRSDYIQYHTNCVVSLDVDLDRTSLLRSLRIVKYRGSGFSADPKPLVIGETGIEVIAFRGTRQSYRTYEDRLSSGIPRLDALLGGGYIRGSSILVSGAPGTSKTSLGASFLASACASGKTSLLASFDESASQIVAHMQSIGLELTSYLQSGALIIQSYPSSNLSPAEIFLKLRALIEDHKPDCLMIDPLSALQRRANPFSAMICEALFDVAKSRGITLLSSSLLDGMTSDPESSVSQVSTLVDTWLHVSYLAHQGERNRALTIIKSRGTSHSNQVRELILSHAGLDLVDVYAAGGEVLMGSARAEREAQDRRSAVVAAADQRQRRLALDRSVAEFEAVASKAAQDLDWKQREVAAMEDHERARLEAEEETALERLRLRRGLDDMRESREFEDRPQ
jgi:circadian clock protein KaiC